MAKSNSFIPIPESALSTMMGKQVHVAGYRWGCTWNLVKVEGRIATLRTPKTKKIITMDTRRLLYSKKNAPKDF